MTDIRKIVVSRETVFSELRAAGPRPVTRAAAIAVITNPFAGRIAEDLSQLFRAGGELGDRLMAELAQLLGAPAVSYGKGAIVGVDGEMEHGGACIHPMLGKPMRAAIGGGKAVIPSNVKVGTGRHAARHPARAQGRRLVVRPFRHAHGIRRRRAAPRRDPGRDGDRRRRAHLSALRTGPGAIRSGNESSLAS